MVEESGALNENKDKGKREESRLGVLRQKIEKLEINLTKSDILNINKEKLMELTKEEIVGYFLNLRRQYIINRNNIQNLYLKERNMIWRIKKISKELEYMSSYPYSQSYGIRTRRKHGLIKE